MNQLRRLPRAGEGERLPAFLKHFRQQRHGVVRGTPPRQSIRPQRLRIPKHEMLGPPRRAVLVNYLHRPPQQPRDELAWVGDRRAGRQENRLGAVVATNPH